MPNTEAMDVPSSQTRGGPHDGFSLSELRYRRLFEAARDGILIVDPGTRQIVDVNPFLEEFLGYSHEEFIGRELYEIGLLKDEATSKAAFRELLAKGYGRHDDLPLQTKDGRSVDVEFVSNLYQEGDRQIIQCNVRDISARKRADAALRLSEERFQLVARAVSDVIWDWDLVTDRLWWSEAFLRTFGYPTNEAERGRASWESRIHPDDRRRTVEALYAAIASKADSWVGEYHFRSKDGGYSVVRDSGCILRDMGGRGIRMVGGIRDITEQKKTEVQSMRTHRMESLGTLAGGIAHDLNNVLTPVMMSIELLKYDSSKDPGRQEILDAIQVSCRRGADLVRQVLTFSRGLESERRPIRMRELIDELNGMICESFPRNIKIVVRVADDLWPVTGDPSQLHQVLLNLAINARDAMPNGGILSLCASNVALDPKELGTSRETTAGRQVLLQVTDTGVGISLNDSEHIFEPFFTTKGVGEGTGFGLAIVHTVVTNHGGFVTVDSEVGRGTTFNIYLPADPALRTEASLPPYSAKVTRGRGELILVVDDEPAVRQITRRTLEMFGYSVIIAGNGAEAVALYAKKAQEIDLVVTDMMMPVMSGAAVIEEIRRINPAARIIAVSGIDIDERTMASVNDFLAKPYTSADLVRTIREVLDVPAGAAS
jgi:PAS domain S-box-containing protein